MAIFPSNLIVEILLEDELATREQISKAVKDQKCLPHVHGLKCVEGPLKNRMYQVRRKELKGKSEIVSAWDINAVREILNDGENTWTSEMFLLPNNSDC